MTAHLYMKKPVVIEALKYDGSNIIDVIDFVDGPIFMRHERISIITLEGEMTVSVGDFVIKGVKGEFYPCKPDVFEMTYSKKD